MIGLLTSNESEASEWSDRETAEVKNRDIYFTFCAGNCDGELRSNLRQRRERFSLRRYMVTEPLVSDHYGLINGY